MRLTVCLLVMEYSSITRAQEEVRSLPAHLSLSTFFSATFSHIVHLFFYIFSLSCACLGENFVTRKVTRSVAQVHLKHRESVRIKIKI